MQVSTPHQWEESRTSVEELKLDSIEGQHVGLLPLLVKRTESQWYETPSISGETWLKFQSRAPISETSILAEIEGLLSWLRANQIRLSKHDQIVEYLLKFPDLLDVIPLAVKATQRHFPEAQLVLKLYRDPEYEDCYLTLYVRLKSYDGSIIERIEAAESEFLDYLTDKEGWLQLTTDFKEPEAENVV